MNSGYVAAVLLHLWRAEYLEYLQVGEQLRIAKLDYLRFNVIVLALPTITRPRQWAGQAW